MKPEEEYFFEGDWTDRNSLIRLDKFDFARKSVRRGAMIFAVSLPGRLRRRRQHDARRNPRQHRPAKCADAARDGRLVRSRIAR
jgi:hypothetical protein